MNHQQKYKRPVLGFVGLIIMMVAALAYQHLTSRPLLAHSEPNQQAHSEASLLSNIQPIHTATAAIGNTVIAADNYEQFWIWTPPRADSKISQAHTLYLLQGEIRPPNMPYYRPSTNVSTSASTNGTNTPTVQASQATLTPQGLGVRTLSDKKIWLVYRATSQTWSGEVMGQLVGRLKAWQRAGNQVMGIQIDYDAPTYQLDEYAQLLRSIRQQLPARYQLSVTGLLDWSNQAEDSQFIQLNDAIDELVIQTYQGTTTLPNYAQYLTRLENLPFDFKVGVIEGGQWQGAAFLENNPHFKGYVVFLR